MARSATLQSVKSIPTVVPKKLQSTSLKVFEPLTPAQETVWAEYKKDKCLMLHGIAGTGKTFCGLYLAMKEVLSRESQYQKVMVVRSTVPTREMGFMPGTKEEKEAVYQAPYEEIFREIFHTNGTPIMDKLREQKTYEFVSTSFLRGVTFHKAIVIVDECQNMTFHELDTVVTRLGKDCKIIFSGDFRQTDLSKNSDKEGLHAFMKIINRMSAFSKVEFHVEDIVRSGLVKSYIETKVSLGLI